MYKVIKLQRIPGGRASMLLGRLRNSRTIRTAATATAVLAAISILAVALTGPSKMMADDDDARTLTVDVAFRNPFYQNNVDPAETLTDATAFSQGDTFIQYGNIYRGGTIPEGKTPFDPDTAPGVIGVYLARGTWTTNLASFLQASKKISGADSDMAFATEIFSFNDNRATIMTDGIVPSAYFSARRVVLGGTRSFRDIVGEVHEENIGENSLTYCNLRVTFKIRRAGEGHGR